MTNISRRVVGLMVFLAVLVFGPVLVTAQESPIAQPSSAPKPALNDQQRSGEALFVQNCPLCHIPSKQKKTLGIQGPNLQGMFGEDADEESLRRTIQQGFAGKMPGFRYTLDQKQINDLIAFLKSGAYIRRGVSE